ncbi:MAG: hypothetical protein JSU05_11915 [Bacteroidetes bacterium]|nr:hypothetical protein [Bacteroidota bacterium]
MKFSLLADILLNVFFPLLVGSLIYYYGHYSHINPFIHNFFPDVLWAWAFSSAILITWQRRAPLLWIVMIYVIAAFFELLQFSGLVKGTADYRDIVAYFTAITITLLLNSFFRKTYKK